MYGVRLDRHTHEIAEIVVAQTGRNQQICEQPRVHPFGGATVESALVQFVQHLSASCTSSSYGSPVTWIGHGPIAAGARNGEMTSPDIGPSGLGQRR